MDEQDENGTHNLDNSLDEVVLNLTQNSHKRLQINSSEKIIEMDPIINPGIETKDKSDLI